MPELPEVETIRLQLQTVLPNQVISTVEIRSKNILHGDEKQLFGKRVTTLRRLGKMLIIDLSGGLSLAIHLKMSGRVVFEKGGDIKKPEEKGWDTDYAKDPHTCVLFTLTSGDRVYYHDQRKFGWIHIVKTSEVENLPYVKKLGPEFLGDLTKEKFLERIKRKNTAIKLMLMDQENIAGIGNIYANDGLWMAKINPKTKTKELSDEQLILLFQSLEDVLKNAIKWKGASENAYRDAFGQRGDVQKHFKVYAREGFLCERCKTKIEKYMLGSRGTYWCPECQK